MAAEISYRAVELCGLTHILLEGAKIWVITQFKVLEQRLSPSY
jgi:hypothetical protein